MTQENQKSDDNLRNQRIQKLNNIKSLGLEPYPETYFPDAKSSELLDYFKSDAEDKETKVFRIAGRVKAKNVMGKASFFRIEDTMGKVQVYGARDAMNEVAEGAYTVFKGLDIGDIVGIEGTLFQTKTAETTLRVHKVTLLAKAIRPLPVVKEKEGEVFDSFENKELKYRRRYLDLIVNEQSREDFKKRSLIIRELRNILENKGYIEVETPMLVSLPSGAAAKPFITKHNALDMNLYMRVAPELYLKRLIVGGMDKVFELNRNFRNEGLSRKHNPEFTMLEVYQAYGNMDTMLELTEELVSGVAKKVLGTTKIEYQGKAVDLTPPWNRMTFCQSIKEYSGIDFMSDKELNELKKEAESKGIDTERFNSKWKLADEVFSELVEPNIVDPVFITDFPKELSPLAKTDPNNPEFARRFEPYVMGWEMGNAFSELNDPFDQKERFLDQVKEREAGDDEAMVYDEDYIYALECAMPPTGGLGIGIDRLIMLLLNKFNIRDTILFPLMKKE